MDIAELVDQVVIPGLVGYLATQELQDLAATAVIRAGVELAVTRDGKGYPAIRDKKDILAIRASLVSLVTQDIVERAVFLAIRDYLGSPDMKDPVAIQVIAAILGKVDIRAYLVIPAIRAILDTAVSRASQDIADRKV